MRCFNMDFVEVKTRNTQLIKKVFDPAKSLNEGQQLDSILLDFSKAFQTKA